MWFSGRNSGKLYSNNIVNYVGTSNPYNEEQVLFGNVFKDLSDQVRVAAEFAQISTTYTVRRSLATTATSSRLGSFSDP